MLLSSTAQGQCSKQTLFVRICPDLLEYSESRNIIEKSQGRGCRAMGVVSRQTNMSTAGTGWWPGDLEVTVVVQASEVAETREGSVGVQERAGWFPRAIHSI